MNPHCDYPPWLKWAMELQALAQAGLFYSKDPYDLERFQRIREISAEMIAHKSGISSELVQGLFCNESGYQTPKLDTRAAVFRDGKILLVQENDGRWSLPGGWVDVTCSVGENAVKETLEEAGLEVRPRRIIAVQDRSRHNQPPYAYGICKIFVQCDLLGGTFLSNTETVDSGWFGPDELPRLSEDRNTAAQIQMCFEAARSPVWEPPFD